MTTLVLGATGFIGGAIAASLHEAGIEARGLTRGRTRRAVTAAPIEWVHGDLRDPASLSRAFDGARFVVHAAGHYPRTGLDRDATTARAVGEMRNVLAAARSAGVERLVYVSSLSTLGAPPAGRALVDERDHYVPGSVADAYFDAKWAMESEVMRAVVEGLDAVVVNPTVVLGPGDVKPTSGVVLVALARKRLPVVLDARVNVVDARAVATATVAAIAKGRRGERYVLGGANTTMKDLAAQAAAILGVPAPTREVPYEAALAASFASEVAARLLGRAPTIPLEFVHMLRHARHVDSAKASKELGLPATNLGRCLGDAVEWFRAHGYFAT